MSPEMVGTFNGSLTMLSERAEKKPAKNIFAMALN
jgi:hypothetical protein